jgi:disulfide bond formation protein DsbB
MIETIQSLNHTLAILGLVGIIATALLIFDLYTERRLQKYVAQWGMKFALLATLASSAMTLLYSEVFGILPCGLCWFERVALYPQVLLIATAIYIKDSRMPIYGIGLSVFGLVISLYHHYIQMGGSQFVKCPVSGVDCSKRFFFEFDFMTFPLMSAILFLFLIILYRYILKGKP